MTEGPSDPFAVMRLIDDRRALLRQLERDSMDKRDLVAAIDCSRSTVDRAIEQLRGHHLVERTNGEYALTFPGRRLLEIYDRYYARVGTVTPMADLLSTLPAECSLPDELLWRGERIEGDGAEPSKPQRVLRELIEDAQRLELSYPVFDSHLVNSLVTRLATDRPTELLVDSACFEYLSTVAPRALDTLSERGSLLRTDAVLEYGIARSESRVAVVCCGPQRQCCGLLRGNEPIARTWAKEAYRHQRTRASRTRELEPALDR